MQQTLGLAIGAWAWLGMIGVGAAHADAILYVVHGIPGVDVGLDPELPVDVSLNGACALPDFRFGEVVGPVAVAADTYDIEIAPADADAPCSADALISAPGIVLEDGVSYSIVAHLTEDGMPTASVFVNDTTQRKRVAIVNVFHTAAAPAVDIKLKRSFPRWLRAAWIRDLANGEQAAAPVWQGDYSVKIFPAGARDPVFGPVDLSLEGETAYLVYAVGSLANETFTLLVAAVEDMPMTKAFVVHGIPGEDLGLDPDLPVDVSLNGECTLTEFTFGEIVGPVELPAGSYDIAIGLADPENPCGNDPVIEAEDVELMADENYSIVAHLTEDGAPTASVFENAIYTRPPWARVNVFHTAAAPAVDVSFQRQHPFWWWPRALADLANGESDNTWLFQGEFDVRISPAGSHDAVFGPAPVSLNGGMTYLVYAVGSLANDTFTLLTAVTEPDGH